MAAAVKVGEFFAMVEDPNARWREHMEDASAQLVEDKFSLFGVFDGHGGKYCSSYCKENVLSQVRLNIIDGKTPEVALTTVSTVVVSDHLSLFYQLTD